MADALLFVSEFRLFICRKCYAGVDRRHLRSHFQKQHAFGQSQLRTIGEYSRSQQSEEVDPRVPPFLTAPIPALPLVYDGLLCQVEPDSCRYICRRVHGIKRHCRTDHQWKQYQRRGRPGKVERARSSDQGGLPWKAVVCQRLFLTGPQSHYIEIRDPLPAEDPVRSRALENDVWQKIESDRRRSKETLLNVVIEDPAVQINPWLSRTQWSTYLKGFERSSLLQLVEEPRGDDDDETPLESFVWATVRSLLRACQYNATTAAGIFVRMEVVQNDQDRRQTVPLQAYLSDATFLDNCRPWQRLILFFVRTRQSEEWTYRLSRPQEARLDLLLRRGRTAVENVGSRSETESQSDDDSVAAGERRTLTPAEEACLEFCVALLDQQVRTNEYESPLICALALLGVSDQGWVGPDRYPSILSAVIKMARFMVVQSALGRTDEPTLATVQGMVRRFMRRGTFSPFEWMVDLRSYGMKIARTTTVEGSLGWVDDTVLYKDLQFTMAEFRSFVHGLVHETHRILHDDLLFGRTIAEPPPTVPWSQLRDNPRHSQVGWNFLRDPRCTLPVDGERWLIDAVQASEELRTKLITGQRLYGAEQYRTHVRNFRTKLLLLVQLTGGQPARIPELLLVQHQDSIHDVHRGVFVEDGSVCLVTRIHKGYTISGDVKIIFRYPPREVGELLVRYLWLVLPFFERLQQHRFAVDPSPFLWPDDAGGPKWSTELVRKALREESLIGLGQALNVQTYRQIAVGMSRRFLRPRDRFDDDAADGTHEHRADGGDEDTTLDLQAGHTSYTAGTAYARLLTEQPGEVYTAREKFRRVSTAWHRFLLFESVRPVEQPRAAGGHKRALSYRDHDSSSTKRQQWRALRTMEPLAQLRQLLGPDSQFRGLQAAAIAAIQEGKSPVLAVMPTGAGKSLLFLLPASYHLSGTTVVIVPLVSLRRDLVRRCRELGIPCAAWDARQPPDPCNVVLVTPESALTEVFFSFLHRLRTTQRLDRIVVDECHLCADHHDSSFRPILRRLRELNQFETPTVLLTATLPPAVEPSLWQNLGFHGLPHHTLRTATTRLNIRYEVVTRTARTVLDFLRTQIARVTRGRVVVYGQTIRTIESIGSQLECPVYHATHPRKDRHLAQFFSGQRRTIVASSALGLGIDLPDVRLVVHVDPPRTLLDYGQESGRAGRDGRTSRAVIVVGPTAGSSCPWMQRFLYVSVPGSGALGERSCRRVVLDTYLDGRNDRTECEATEEKCDLCAARSTDPLRSELDVENGSTGSAVDFGRVVKADDDKREDDDRRKKDDGRKDENGKNDDRENDDEKNEGKNDESDESDESDDSNGEKSEESDGPDAASTPYNHQVVQRRAVRFYNQSERRFEARQLQNTVALLTRLHGTCLLCYPYDATEHSSEACVHPGRATYDVTVRWLQQTIKYDRYAGCFRCGFPQALCTGRWQIGASGYVGRANGTCNYSTLLYEAGAIFCMVDADGRSIREDLYRRISTTPHSRDGVVRYFGQKTRLAGFETNRLFTEVVALYKDSLSTTELITL